MSKKKKVAEIDEKINALREDNKKALKEYEELCTKRANIILSQYGLKLGDIVWFGRGQSLTKNELQLDRSNRSTPLTLFTPFDFYLCPYKKNGELSSKRYFISTKELETLVKAGD